ncbi:hypothetical protein NB697_000756 [Xanthomonas sacchari]|nr:hypothetical protein [Xanthomonas sacchari]
MDTAPRWTARILAAAPIPRGLLLSLCCAATLCACGNAAQAPASATPSVPPTAPAPAANGPTAPAATHDAATAQVPPGHYATQPGWGQLTVQPDARFILETQNVDAGCSFSGTLHGTQAAVDDGTCTLQFAPKADGVAVSATAGAESACREYCGGNGSFAGDYLKQAATCTPEAMQRTRKAFQTSYDHKDYAGAEAALAPLYRDCVAALSFSDAGAIRNDYALTQHKLGDDAGCRQTLAPYQDDAKRSDDAISEGMTPALVDDYLRVIRAARTNLKLCGEGRG